MEPVGRVFLAAGLPPEIRFALSEVLGDLTIPGRRVAAENWHITVRFLDVIDRVTYERFITAIDRPQETSFRIGLDGFGAFPNPKKATVFWADVGVGAEQLASLNEEAEEAAVAAGVLPEERPYRPHLTLSRIRPPADVSGLADEALSLSWRCERLTLFRSHQRRGGVQYEPLDSIDLIG